MVEAGRNPKEQMLERESTGSNIQKIREKERGK